MTQSSGILLTQRLCVSAVLIIFCAFSFPVFLCAFASRRFTFQSINSYNELVATCSLAFSNFFSSDDRNGGSTSIMRA